MEGIVRERKGKGSMTGGRKDRGKMKGILREREWGGLGIVPSYNLAEE